MFVRGGVAEFWVAEVVRGVGVVIVRLCVGAREGRSGDVWRGWGGVSLGGWMDGRRGAASGLLWDIRYIYL